MVACSRKSCLGPAEVRLRFFNFVSRDMTTLLMTTASLAPQTSSDGSIATHYTQITSKFLCSYKFHAISLTMPRHLTHPTFKIPLSLPSSPSHWISTTRGEVRNLPSPAIRQGNLELTAFLHSLDNTRNTKMLYCPHPTSTLLGAKQPRTK